MSESRNYLSLRKLIIFVEEKEEYISFVKIKKSYGNDNFFLISIKILLRPTQIALLEISTVQVSESRTTCLTCFNLTSYNLVTFAIIQNYFKFTLRSTSIFAHHLILIAQADTLSN